VACLTWVQKSFGEEKIKKTKTTKHPEGGITISSGTKRGDLIMGREKGTTRSVGGKGV